MKKKAVNQVLRLILLAGFLTFAVSARSQTAPAKAKVAISFFGPKAQWNAEIEPVLKKELGESGWVKVVDFENSPDFVLFVQSAEQGVSQSTPRVISVAVTQALPAPWVDYLAKEEIPYKVMPAFKREKLPKKGKFVREYVTRQMLQEYRRLLDFKTYAVEKNSLARGYKQMANDALTAISRVWVRK